MAKLNETKLNHMFLAEREGRVLVVIPQGDSIGYRDSDVPVEIKRVQDAIEVQGTDDLVIDLGTATYYGTLVIGALHALTKFVKDRGGSVVMCSASEDMKRVLSAMKLDEVWMNFDSRKIALKAVGR